MFVARARSAMWIDVTDSDQSRRKVCRSRRAIATEDDPSRSIAVRVAVCVGVAKYRCYLIAARYIDAHCPRGCAGTAVPRVRSDLTRFFYLFFCDRSTDSRPVAQGRRERERRHRHRAPRRGACACSPERPQLSPARDTCPLGHDRVGMDSAVMGVAVRSRSYCFS